MKKRTAVLLIIGLWLLIAVAVVGYNQYTVSTGTRVLLKTVPLDPRDILRGDYVILRYEISQLDLNSIISDNKNITQGSRIYLILEKGFLYWGPKEIRTEKPEGNEVFLTGKVNWINSGNKNINVEYGIESYFIPEGTGKQIEELQGIGLGVEVSVDKNGRAVITKLYLDDDELEILKAEQPNWSKVDPLDFLNILIKRPENPFTIINYPPKDWIKEKHIQKLILLMDSKEPASPVVSVISSYYPFNETSTVGNEAMFLIEGFKTGRYLPSLCSVYYFKGTSEEYRKWWEEQKSK